MFFKATLLLLLFFGFRISSMFLLIVNLALMLFGKRFFAAFLDNFKAKYNTVADPFKKKLFKELNEISSPDSKKIRVLEAGLYIFKL